MPSRSKPRRTHILGSCRTCRRRHVRCDTNRPACEACAAVGLTCEGFADEIQWAPTRKRSRTVIKGGPVASLGIRRQLLTEKDRLLMGLALSKDLVRGSVDASLDEINIYHHSQPQRSTASTSNERSESGTIQGICLDDFLHIQNSENDLNIDEPKCRRADLTDLHLQDSRLSTETLGKQVYGIPETWLSLLSQTTRLANVMEAMRNAQNTDIVMSCNTHQALQDRASRLESAIHSFGAREIKPDTHSSEHEHHHALNYTLVLQAFNSALLIFFYRRVRQVHRAILQSEVEHIIVALSAFYSGLIKKTPPGAGDSVAYIYCGV